MKLDRQILVTGSGGFLGKDLIRHLLDRGFYVKAMIRNPVNMPFIKNENIQIVYGDMCDTESLKAALQDVSVVVHLAAAKSDEKNSYDVNVEGAKRLSQACGESGCKRIINISTQSVKIKNLGTYGQTKKIAEDLLHSSGINVTSLRPSIVYGEEQLGVFGTVVNFINKLPFIPILGNGKWISAPIYIGDVSEAIISCIENDNTIGRRYDIGGPDRVSFDEFIDKICFELSITCYKLHIPFWFSLAVARALATVSDRPPITISNVLGSNQDTDIDITPAKRDFGFNPMSFDRGIKRVVRREPKESDQMKLDQSEKEYELNRESVLISNYLIGCNPSKELCERYVLANYSLFESQENEKIYPELDIIRRYPVLLPFIDAAAGLLKPDSIVRKKILLMSAILETTPLHADYFLHKPDSLWAILINMISSGVLSVLKLFIGVPILLITRRG